ncbi:SDR family oxidoreductase [Nakamurella leprariae]|uniref:SDR family oxidoreductase n=1 Tax=Nakamurella leprariae TaxID=2803911 RepID=A0A938YJ43_9ACTN|nr:SDR family oxidoreductase [Nakamurella leprariae]MBM9469079.1 SDR family oxidoreductase [Nakamurella leprariae]
MRVVIAGGHGKIGLRLARLLAEREDHAVSLVRKPEHDADVIAVGAHPQRFDLESGTADELAGIVRGADAVVFAAGAGPNSGAARKDTVDRAAAALLADAAEQAGVRRYLMVSAIGVDRTELPTGQGEVWDAYVSAKQRADEDLRGRDLDWTIVRPGGLTDTSGTGRVTLAAQTEMGPVPREDVAAVLVALLDEPGTAHLSLDLVGGDLPIVQAVQEVQSAR